MPVSIMASALRLGRACSITRRQRPGVVGLGPRPRRSELAKDGVRVNGGRPRLYPHRAAYLSEEHSLGPKGAEAAGAFIPNGVGSARPEEIADVIVFLAVKFGPVT